MTRGYHLEIWRGTREWWATTFGPRGPFGDDRILGVDAAETPAAAAEHARRRLAYWGPIRFHGGEGTPRYELAAATAAEKRKIVRQEF